MGKSLEIASNTVSVYTRHSPECSKREDPTWRRCGCRKYLYIFEAGHDRRVSAKTRSWEQAERLAQAERDLRDPTKLELRRIQERDRAKIAAQEAAQAAERAGSISVDEALGLWIAGFKRQSLSTAKTYRTAVKKVSKWAANEGITLLREVTAAHLYKWRAEWSLESPRMEDRMGPTSQNQFLTRLKSFFRWAYELEHISKDPSKSLKSIQANPKQTMPLTPEQFDQVIAATERYDDRRRDQDRFGTELRALCLTMRWSGLRITDALMLPRTALTGNSLSLTTLKTKEDTLPVLPDHAVAALTAIRPRQGVHAGYFFWSKASSHLVLGKQWAARIKRLNRHLNLTDDHGEPMIFHSHMLRDTYAVELLLAGVPIETVSKMLTHKSVRVTERHYAPWVKSRQKQLQAQAIDVLRKMGQTVSL
jgi:integrase/recombinase XerD